MVIIRRPSQNYRTRNNPFTSMCNCKYINKCVQRKKIRILLSFSESVITLNIYCFIITVALISSANSNTMNMNTNVQKDGNAGVNKGITNLKGNLKKRDSDNNQNVPSVDNYDDSEHVHSMNSEQDYSDVNFNSNNPYYNENLLKLDKFYSSDNNAYSNYDDYKKYYLNPSNPLPKSNVKFKISSRIVQTRYGKLQGIVLGMDEHRYLKPLEVFLGVPYATPPVGTNR